MSNGASRLAVVCLLSVAVTVVLAAGPPQSSAAPRTSAREDGPRWQALTLAQRSALAPLEKEWPTIDSVRKQKWLLLVDRVKSMPAEERARISLRMSDWARLSPAERGQARIRYEETRDFPEPDRQARWKDYQALSDEEKKQFAAKAAAGAASSPRTPGEPGGVGSGSRTPALPRDGPGFKANLVPNPALAQRPKQVSPTVLQAAPGATTTPINRRPAPPAHQQTGMPKIATTPEFVNRGTLLPKRGPQAAAVAPVPRPVGTSGAASAPR